MQLFVKLGALLACSFAVVLGVVLFSDSEKYARPVSASVSTASAHQDMAPRVDPHEAKVLEEALRKKPGHSPVLMRMATLAAGEGRKAEAIGHLRAALKYEPENTEARLELGRLLFETGDLTGAIVETEKILATSPNHPDALYNLGAIYGNLGNNKLAEKYWTDLVKTAPNSDAARRAKALLPQLATES